MASCCLPSTMHSLPNLSIARPCSQTPTVFLPCSPKTNIHNSKTKLSRPFVPNASSNMPSWDSGGIDIRNIERAIKLHSAISNKSFKELIQVVTDEWHYYCGSLSLEPREACKKVIQMLFAFIVANKVIIFIQPTEDYGVNVGIKWATTFDKDKLPLGLNCTISTSHLCQGSVYLRDGMGIIGSFIQMPFAQKLEGILVPIIDKLVPKGVLQEKTRVTLVYSLLSLSVMLVSTILFKNITF
ncbi:uncharacterized protein LOC121973294 [Zingiber officinale]|uniref:Uncharacterized protein n=1 Tax=Zingiber officinale TaxID=94328 RepID=A0A8J5H2B9_ZINOF|nr:uncharacterized protein LOC121973294 [Zingiber officinale]KAG6514064.1 hypothetical protein ZIOFF_024403 [Zingiber officinale]